MASTYYIRSWDPRSTYPTNPQEGDICYTITLNQEWAPVAGVKKDNIVKEEIYQNGAWVEQGGGGGGGLDFYIPKQTVTLDQYAAELSNVDIPTTGENGAYYDVFVYIGGEDDMYLSLHGYYSGDPIENFHFSETANGLFFEIMYNSRVGKWFFICEDNEGTHAGEYTVAVSADPLGVHQ